MTTSPAPMDALLARLDKGEDFAEVARTGSQDPGTAQGGGRLPGWILLGQLPPDVEPQVKKLAKGQRTGAIAQRTGTYVFQVFDLRPRENVTPFEQRKAEVMQSLEARKRGAMVDEYLMGLRKSYQLKIDGPGWTVVGDKFVTFSDSMAGMAITNPAASGLTDEELSSNAGDVARSQVHGADMLSDLGKSERMERPPLSRSDMVRMYVEGHAMNEILVAEAKAQGLADSPNVRRQVSRGPHRLPGEPLPRAQPVGVVARLAQRGRTRFDHGGARARHGRPRRAARCRRSPSSRPRSSSRSSPTGSSASGRTCSRPRSSA